MDETLDIKINNQYEPYLVDVTREIKEKPYLFYYGGIGFSPTGNLQAIKAKAKQGKTQFTKIIMAAAVCGECMGISRSSKMDEAKILYCDTEMDEDDTTLVAQGVLTLCSKTDSRYRYNEPCDRFMALSLRCVDTKKRWPIILQAIDQFRPTLVIIDGVRDLITDFNDLTMSSEIIGDLLRACTEYKCAIWNILHENKNDDNMRGHLGTELLNKVTDVFETRKKNENGDITFHAEQTDTRNRDIEEFVFCVDNFGVPCPPEMGYASKNDLSHKMKMCYDDLWNRHNESVGEDGRTFLVKLDRTNFLDSVMSILEVKKSRAYDIIRQAEQQKIIWYDKVSGHIQYRDKADDMPF